MIRRLVVVSTLAALAVLLAGVSQAAALPAPDLVFTMKDGFGLPARVWRPPAGAAVRGVILALHGFTDSRDAWELPAPGFAAAGYTVFAPDQRGFGGTADRGAWVGQDVLVDDAAEVAAQLRARFPGQRLVLMGESMGGAVALCLAARAPATADAYVLLAPAVWGRAQMALYVRGALWAADRVAPGYKLFGDEVQLDIAASDNRDALIRLATDPLTLRGSTIAMLNGLVNLMDAAQAATPDLPPHTLVLAGRLDQIVPVAATAAAWAKLPPGVRRGFYLNGYHMLLRDRDRALVESDILAWLDDPDRWLPSGADVNASAWLSDHGWSGAVAGALPAKVLDGAGERPTWPY
jgi:alpha-beta hydrolase superfamily lysophospholipase